MTNQGEEEIMVGTVVGESTTQEFRMAVTPGQVSVQDLVAVDAQLRETDGQTKHIRIWAKVDSIERINPLFPRESGQELADLQVNPFDTVISMSREMVTAVCRVLGYEEQDTEEDQGKLKKLRYPPQPASPVYRPKGTDIERIVLGELSKKENRGLDIATLSTRPDVNVKVDGHAIVTRHLAILAMTGAGKSWTARRIIEQLAEKKYPIVIFDPHGDYTGLAQVPALREGVRLFYAHLPIFEEDVDDAIRIVNGLSGEEMSSPQRDAFDTLFSAAPRLLDDSNLSSGELCGLLFQITRNPNINKYPLRKDLFALSYIADAASILAKQKGSSSERDRLAELGFDAVRTLDGRLAGTYGALARQLRRAAFALREMVQINRSRAGQAQPLPSDRNDLVQYGQISVISLAGYTDEFQATLYTLIARHLFRSRVQGKLPFQFLLILEEAHNFVPGRAEQPAIARSIATTKQIAQEGRKFGVGLLLISQRPSRLDETTLSQCNSYIIMRMVNPADQSYVRRVVETLGEDEARLLPDLDVGEAILSGQFVSFPALVKIKEPMSKGEREERDAFEALEDAYRQLKEQGG